MVYNISHVGELYLSKLFLVCVALVYSPELPLKEHLRTRLQNAKAEECGRDLIPDHPELPWKGQGDSLEGSRGTRGGRV